MSAYRFSLAISVLVLGVPPLASAEKLITVSKERAYGEPTEQTAVVYVVRPAFIGKAVKSWAFVDQEPLGANKGKHYTFGLVEPGEHLFWAKAENTSALEFDIEAGKTYYLKHKIKMGGMKARVKLMQIDESEGKAAIEKCKYTQLTPAGEERAREIIEEKYEVALKKARGSDADEEP